MAENKLWNIRIKESLIDKLGKLGADLGYPSGNAFVADALDEWADTIAEMMAELQKGHEANKKIIRERVLSQLRSERRK